MSGVIREGRGVLHYFDDEAVDGVTNIRAPKALDNLKIPFVGDPRKDLSLVSIHRQASDSDKVAHRGLGALFRSHGGAGPALRVPGEPDLVTPIPDVDKEVDP